MLAVPPNGSYKVILHLIVLYSVVCWLADVYVFLFYFILAGFCYPNMQSRLLPLALETKNLREIKCSFPPCMDSYYLISG